MKRYEALAARAQGKTIKYRDGTMHTVFGPESCVGCRNLSVEALNEEGWEVVEEKPKCPREKCKKYGDQCVCKRFCLVEDPTKFPDEFEPVEEKPKAKTKIWPVEPKQSGSLTYTEEGTRMILDAIFREPRWTGRYEFTLPSGRKVLTDEQRIVVKGDEWFWIGNSSVERLETNPFPKCLSEGWTLATPTGVEVLA